MVFKSLEFPFFLFVVVTAYWGLGTQRARTSLLLVASYVFYGWCDYRFLSLLLLTSVVDYFCGLLMEKTGKASIRKLFLTVSIVANLGSLVVFKYFDFLEENVRFVLRYLGVEVPVLKLNLPLPLGISFYNFQALTYTIDVYTGRCKTYKDWVTFMLFVAFFPTVLSGPIQRARDLIPQLETLKRFDETLATDGLRYILVGYFLKCVVADNLSAPVMAAYSGPSAHSAAVLLLGTYAFALQIYFDLAGYTYIAMGAAALFGFRILPNFDAPYLAQSVKEFWSRWHISLTSWFRDYVYILWLGGNRVSRRRRVFNVLATFLISGLWHGASWNFALWGLLNGIFYFVPKPFKGTNMLSGFANGFCCFNLICLGWIFFRAEGLGDAVDILTAIAGLPDLAGLIQGLATTAVIACISVGVLVVEFVQKRQPQLVSLDAIPRVARLSMYTGLLLALFFYGQFDRIPFIYFKF